MAALEAQRIIASPWSARSAPCRQSCPSSLLKRLPRSLQRTTIHNKRPMATTAPAANSNATLVLPLPRNTEPISCSNEHVPLKEILPDLYQWDTRLSNPNNKPPIRRLANTNKAHPLNFTPPTLNNSNLLLRASLGKSHLLAILMAALRFSSKPTRPPRTK